MKIDLKQAILGIGIMAVGLTTSVKAGNPTVLNFKLVVEGSGISNPKVSLQSGGSAMQDPSSPNTFQVQATQGDSSFQVDYQYQGSSRTARCQIGGMPNFMKATIDPTKGENNACTTEES